MRTADRCITGRSPFIWLGLNVSCDDATPADGVIEDRHPSQVPVLVFPIPQPLCPPASRALLRWAIAQNRSPAPGKTNA